MATYVAFFRGINVGGHNKLPMRRLEALCESLGLRNVGTYIQSGNVVFESTRGSPKSLQEGLATAVESNLGFAPELIVLQAKELTKAIESNPYPRAASDPRSLHVAFLSSAPENPDLDALERLRRDTERFALGDRVLYLHAPDGIGRSKLAAGIEKSLGVSATARNWRTVLAVQALATRGEER